MTNTPPPAWTPERLVELREVAKKYEAACRTCGRVTGGMPQCMACWTPRRRYR